MIKKFELEESNLSPNFIGSWIIDNSLCDELVVYFENNQLSHKQGVTGSKSSINLDDKNRIDLTISPKDINLPKNKANHLSPQKIQGYSRSGTSVEPRYLATPVTRIFMLTFSNNLANVLSCLRNHTFYGLTKFLIRKPKSI